METSTTTTGNLRKSERGSCARTIHRQVPQRPRRLLLRARRWRTQQLDERLDRASGRDSDLVLVCARHTTTSKEVATHMIAACGSTFAHQHSSDILHQTHTTCTHHSPPSCAVRPPPPAARPALAIPAIARAARWHHSPPSCAVRPPPPAARLAIPAIARAARWLRRPR
jgi:hypothetical protein